MKYLLFFLLSTPSIIYSQGFEKKLLGSIIQIEKELPTGQIIPHGTGVAIYNYIDKGSGYIATCAHVLKNRFVYIRIPATDSAIKYLNIIKKDTIRYQNRIWLFDGYTLRTKFELIKGVTFVSNDTLDIGVIKFNAELPVLIAKKDTFEIGTFASIPRSMIKQKNSVEVGTDVYFLGFPFMIGSKYGYNGSGFYSDKKINPLLRAGIIAWKSDESKEFLVDGLSYGGNSGSPIFTQTSIFNDKPALIGMVLGHLSDMTEKETDPDKKADVNQGLARCIWIDEILTLINLFEKNN